MGDRKETKKYTFTVEGETEQWYLYWLRNQINACQDAVYQVSIVASVQQSPKSYAKTVHAKSTPCITHLCDVESNEEKHVRKFKNILSELNAVKKEKKISYALGYSNFTFELWMILHKSDYNGPLASRKHYLSRINKAFNENFESLAQYKEENNFKRCLSKLTLTDVRSAVCRAKAIMERNQADGKRVISHCSFKYYPDNPSLTIWESVAGILKDCKLI